LSRSTSATIALFQKLADFLRDNPKGDCRLRTASLMVGFNYRETLMKRGARRDVMTNQPFDDAKAIARFHKALTEFEAVLRETPIRLIGLEPKQIYELLDRLDHLFSSKPRGDGDDGPEAP
jgi:hypothetical protein